MEINHDQLKAFEIIAELGSISAAASQLRLTQPALTQRLQKLEAEVGTTLFFRLPKGLKLTAFGQKLLRYVHQKKLLEAELLGEFSTAEKSEKQLTGTVRIIGYSTIFTTYLIPALAAFLRAHPRVQIQHIASQSLTESFGIKNALYSGKADFAFSVDNILGSELISHELGQLKMVAICNKKYPERMDTLLDTKPSDRTTLEFMLKQESVSDNFDRSFFHDEEGLIRGVELGLGQAVIFKDLLDKSQLHLINAEFSPSFKTLYLHALKQNLRPKLISAIEQEIITKVPKIISQ